MENLEKVYDLEIAPLMGQIISICKKHKIPMLATFQFSDDGMCTTSLPVEGCNPKIQQATDVIYDRPLFMTLVTTIKRPDAPV